MDAPCMRLDVMQQVIPQIERALSLFLYTVTVELLLDLRQSRRIHEATSTGHTSGKCGPQTLKHHERAIERSPTTTNRQRLPNAL